MDARIQKIIEATAVTRALEFEEDNLDDGWTRSMYACLTYDDQQKITWRDFHDAVQAVLDERIVTVKIYELTASESTDGATRSARDNYIYTFRVFELPTGEAMVPGENTNDCWYESVNAVEANGNAFIVEITDTGRKVNFTMWEIRASVAGSAGEFGREAVPESLRLRFLS